MDVLSEFDRAVAVRRKQLMEEFEIPEDAVNQAAMAESKAAIRALESDQPAHSVGDPPATESPSANQATHNPPQPPQPPQPPDNQ